MSAIVVPERIKVLMHETGVVQEMDLDEYLQGVVRAEMGPHYPLEALKAQAIAARSFALAAGKHGTQAHVCTDHTHCQAWKADPAPLPARAARETRGTVIAFDGAIATAFYFGHCDGQTRDFEDVWSASSPVPYCRGVPCICGHTQKWGHGVGMCQEGARAMAAQGSTAQEILHHYYAGIEIVTPTSSWTMPSWTMAAATRPGTRAIAGTFPRAGIPVVISDPWGNRWLTTSGDKPEHGVGGFEILLWFDTTYTVEFLDQIFPVEVAGAFTFLTFEESIPLPAEEARLVSHWLPLSEAQAWLDRFEGYQTYRGWFALEEEASADVAAGAAWTMAAATRPGARVIAGTLPRAGIPVVISDPWGNRWLTTSGDKPEHGVGGFEVLLWFDTTYTVEFLDQIFPVEVAGAFTFLTFAVAGDARARLVSKWQPADRARDRLARFESMATYQGLFDVELRS